jgi:hypothetical protein
MGRPDLAGLAAADETPAELHESLLVGGELSGFAGAVHTPIRTLEFFVG